ncbi:MAG: DUF1552 domain-containing protein [Myxococcota bacterium]
MNRRSLLRGILGGATVTVGLPVFEYMLDPSGRAFAGGGALPDRFGLWFWGNGVKPDRWVPPSQGANWVPSEELAPMADLVPWVSVISGTEVRTATHPHHSGMTGILTGQHYHQLGTTRDTIVSTFARQSVDQDAADHLHLNQTPFRSIEAAVCRFRGTDEGSTFEHLSHNGPNNFNPSEYDPHTLWTRLFGVPLDPGTDRARLSVLDAVKDQTSHLERRLGTADKARLEQHLDSVRQLELRLTTLPGACTPPADPGSYPDLAGIEQIEAKNLAMSELITMALACDLTRVFSLMFSSCGSGAIFSTVGMTDGMHLTCHTEPDPQPLVHQRHRVHDGPARGVPARHAPRHPRGSRQPARQLRGARHEQGSPTASRTATRTSRSSSPGRNGRLSGGIHPTARSVRTRHGGADGPAGCGRGAVELGCVDRRIQPGLPVGTLVTTRGPVRRRGARCSRLRRRWTTGSTRTGERASRESEHPRHIPPAHRHVGGALESSTGALTGTVGSGVDRGSTTGPIARKAYWPASLSHRPHMQLSAP